MAHLSTAAFLREGLRVRIRLPPAESHSARWNSHALHPLDGKDSPNTGWRNEAFRGFADYLQTAEFRDALAALIRLSREKRIAIMCAEAVPWGCHRTVVGDALTVGGVPVVEILSESSWRMHQLTPFARVEGTHHISPRAGDPAVTKSPTGTGLEQELENAPHSVFGKAQIGRHGRLEFRLSRRLSTASPWSASGLEACSPLGGSAGVSCPTQGTEARVAQE